MTELRIVLPREITAEPLESGEIMPPPLIPARNVIRGLLHPDRIPPLDASQITTGTIEPDRLPPIDGGLIVGEIPSERISAGIARDIEVQAAWENHLSESDPHPQYARGIEVQAAIQQALEDLESADGSAALAAHVAAADPHVQYQTEAEVAGAINSAIAALPSSDSAIAAAMVDHIAEADPHPQYVNGIEVATAINGAITELNLNAYATELEVTSAISGAVAAHTPAADPHPQYRQENQLIPAVEIAYGAIKGYRPGVPLAQDKLLALSDGGTVQISSGSNPITLILQADIDASFELWTEIDLLQDGIGALTITPAQGVDLTRRGSGPFQLAGAGAAAQLKKLGNNRWRLMGELA